MAGHPLRSPHPCSYQPPLRPRNHRPRSASWILPSSREESPDQQVPGQRSPELASLEAVLFLADEPLTHRRIATLANLPDAATVRQLLARLQELYLEDGSSFQIQEVAGGVQLLTRPEWHAWLLRLRQNAVEGHLSGPARETLAIIAYRQPIPRADIEAIRGVGCSEILKQLMEKGLIRLAGREETLGRPALYETTKKFLQLLGLRSLSDLPPGQGLFLSERSNPSPSDKMK